MDDLDRIQAYEESARQKAEEQTAHPKHEAPKLENYITRIGCINTRFGWYGLGYNEHTKALELMERIP